MSQAIPLFANPGQTVTIVVQTLDGYGERVDDNIPVVTDIFFPDRTPADNFPQNMVKIDTGLYTFNVNIPSGSDYLGTFIANVKFNDPDTGNVVWQVFTINVARPFGNSTATPI